MSLEQANNYLAVHLHHLLSQEKKKNIFFSPFSISVAMGMLLCGAEGDTASELRAALGHEHAGIKKEDVAKCFEENLSFMLEHRHSYTLSLANSILSQNHFPVKEEYKKIISNSFRALMLEVDFEKDGKKIINQINDWVKEKTNNMIPKFMNYLHPDTVLVLLNAVYFKGTWMHRFEKRDTNSQIFYNHGTEDKAEKIQMMHMKHFFPFCKESTFQAVMLPYVGDEIAMLILLPHEKNGLDTLEANLSLSFVEGIMKKLRKTKLRLALPRFRFEFDKSLRSSLKELGAKLVFFPGTAELTNLSDAPDLYLSEIFHKAVVEVNEEGCTAAALTRATKPGYRSAPPLLQEFIADHPFTFLIYNIKTGLILFMGRVSEL